MGTIVASSILSRVSITLLDETGVRWEATELLSYLNSAFKAIVVAKPDAYVVNGPFQLVAGSKQQIPAAGHQFLRATRNMGAAGTNPGRAITQTTMESMDDIDPFWHIKTGTEVKHYVFDPRDPTIFYVYPNLVTRVDVLYSAVPPNVAANAAIPVPDIYDEALYVFTIGYALAKNTKDGDLQKSLTYWNRFNGIMGVKEQKQAGFNPNVTPKAS